MYSITYMSIDLAQRIQLESEKKIHKKGSKIYPCADWIPEWWGRTKNTNTRQDQKAGLESRASNKKSQETVTFFYEIRNDPPSPLECVTWEKERISANWGWKISQEEKGNNKRLGCIFMTTTDISIFIL